MHRPLPSPQDQVISEKTTILESRNETVGTLGQYGYGKMCVIFMAFIFGMVGVFMAVVTRKQVLNGDACEMTYSGSRFQQIPWIRHQGPNVLECSMNDPTGSEYSTTTNLYRLMQFYDHRDIRFTRKSTGDGPCQDKMQPIWNPSRNVVLFVPGHWGSLEQARSLGAHGIKLTEQRKDAASLRQKMQELRFGNNDLKLFDVYALDFSEQSSALHGYMLWEQSSIIEHAVRSVVLRTQASLESEEGDSIKIYIVGHSIGGIVARGAYVLHDKEYTLRYVSAIITLATPHSLPIAIDPSLRQFYRSVNQQWSNLAMDCQIKGSLNCSIPPIVSISGGLRDELVHPSWCTLDNVVPGRSISVLASDVGHFNSPRQFSKLGGLDHKAIVWCHNVLSVVANLIHLKSQPDDSNQNAATDVAALVENLILDKDTDNATIKSRQEVGYSYENRVAYEANVLQKSIPWMQRIAFESSTIDKGPIAFAILCTVAFIPLLTGTGSFINKSLYHLLLSCGMTLSAWVMSNINNPEDLAIKILISIWAWSIHTILAQFILQISWWIPGSSLMSRMQSNFRFALGTSIIVTLSACTFYRVWQNAQMPTEWDMVSKACIFLCYYSLMALSVFVCIITRTCQHELAASVLLFVPVQITGCVLYAFSIIDNDTGGIYAKHDQGAGFYYWMVIHSPMLFQTCRCAFFDTDKSCGKQVLGNFSRQMIIATMLVLMFGSNLYAYQIEESLHITRHFFFPVSALQSLLWSSRQSRESVENEKKRY